MTRHLRDRLAKLLLHLTAKLLSSSEFDCVGFQVLFMHRRSASAATPAEMLMREQAQLRSPRTPEPRA